MKIYYVNDNQQNDGYHEVHEDGCSWLSKAISTTSLGYCSDCKEAVRKAEAIYPKSDGCYYCCNECHTR